MLFSLLLLLYLNLDIGVASDVVDGLFSYSLITSPSEDGKAIKPVYLKDNYEKTYNITHVLPSAFKLWHDRCLVRLGVTGYIK